MTLRKVTGGHGHLPTTQAETHQLAANEDRRFGGPPVVVREPSRQMVQGGPPAIEEAGSVYVDGTLPVRILRCPALQSDLRCISAPDEVAAFVRSQWILDEHVLHVLDCLQRGRETSLQENDPQEDEIAERIVSWELGQRMLFGDELFDWLDDVRKHVGCSIGQVTDLYAAAVVSRIRIDVGSRYAAKYPSDSKDDDGTAD